jgi:hypothetical protein
MSDLRAELDAVLQDTEPGSPPVDAVMRRGRRLKSRRRLSALSAALVVGVLVAAGYATQKAPPKAPAHTVSPPAGITVTPGLWSDGGVIATGTTDGEPWQVTVTDPASRQCFSGTVGSASLGFICDVAYPANGVPLAWQLLSDGSHQALITGVAPDVRYVVLTVAGQQLKLIPVIADDGQRYVGLVGPADLTITTGYAYLADGQRQAITQFSPPGWTRADADSPPIGAAALGPVEADGQGWTASAEEGSWGTCIATGDMLGLVSCTTAAPLTTLAALGVAYASDGSPAVVYGSAPPDAASLKVTLTDGGILHVPVTTVGNENLWAFAIAGGQVVMSWKAYSSAGKLLGTGGLP